MSENGKQDPIGPLEDALKLSPQNIPLRLYVAGLLAERGYMSRAVEHFRAAAAAEPGNIEAALGLGRALLQSGELGEAVRVLNRALGMDPEKQQSARLHVELARALLAMDRPDDAREHYLNGVRQDPALADEEMAERLESDEASEMGPGSPIGLSLGSDGPDLVEPETGQAITFNDVGGMAELKELLRMSIVYPFKNPEIFKAYGRKVGGGILLYGPPGCGKTYIAAATAGEIKARFFSIGLNDIMDMWYGKSERKLHDVFESARSQAPAVLFFDEIEALGHSRTKMHNFTAGRTLVNQFLLEMDGLSSRNENLLIVGATNSPWDLDPAFRRPGRFDRVIFVAPPDATARVEILKLHVRNKPVERLDYDKIAARMDRFSGADVQAVCDAAAERALQEALRSGAIRKITTADFMEAVKQARPTTTEWIETARNYARYSNQSGLYNGVLEYLDPKKS